jgi:hypothetical protein
VSAVVGGGGGIGDGGDGFRSSMSPFLEFALISFREFPSSSALGG